MNRQKGFTLIELLAVVAIIGILAAIALPSYDYAVRKANRGGAQSVLMDVAQRQQQYLLDARSYASDLATLNMTVPADVDRNYTISVSASAGPPPSFTVTATPKSGTKQVSDGALSINNTGDKTPADKW